MKTCAGNLFFEITGNWIDESNYAYRDEINDIEIKIERSPVGPSATPDELLDIMIERLKMLGPLEDTHRSQTQISGTQGASIKVHSRQDGDTEITIMNVVVFKLDQTNAITLTALASDTKQGQLEQVWTELLTSMKKMEFPVTNN